MTSSKCLYEPWLKECGKRFEFEERDGGMVIAPSAPRRIGVREVEPPTRRFGVREVEPPTRRFGLREHLHPRPSTGTSSDDDGNTYVRPESEAGKSHVSIKHKWSSERKPTQDVLKKLGLLGSEWERTTKLVKESIEQHKYAHLSNASYEYARGLKDGEYSFQKAAEYIPELGDFHFDRELSGENAAVLVNPKTKEVFTSYRGTNPKKLGDLGTDVAIVAGVERAAPRFRNAKKLQQKVHTKYGSGWRKTTGGHSLGGGQSIYVAEKFGIEGFHYDPAISITQALKKSKGSLQKIFKTTLDPVSFASPLARAFGKKRKTILVNMRDDSKNTHGLGQMLAEPEFLRDASGNFIKKNGKRIPITTEGGTHFFVKKVPHSVTIAKGAGYAADAAYLGSSIYDLVEAIKHADKTEVRDIQQHTTASELAFLPGIGTAFEENTFERRAMDSLGKKLLGSGFHTEQDIRDWEREQRIASDMGTALDSSRTYFEGVPESEKKVFTEDEAGVLIDDTGHRWVEYSG